VDGGFGYASAMSFLYFAILILLLAIVYFALNFQSKKS
jgi:ABC-type sugar transport system permease subunit